MLTWEVVCTSTLSELRLRRQKGPVLSGHPAGVTEMVTDDMQSERLQDPRPAQNAYNLNAKPERRRRGK